MAATAWLSQGAYIDGPVNLDGATKVRPLWIVDSNITGEFSFADAETKVVSLDRTAVSSIRGDGVMIDGSLLLRGTIIDGSLQLFGAEIMGSLSCSGGRIEGRRWRSQRLAADLITMTIGGNVELRNGFVANGLILFDNSEIGGTFNCSEGTFLSGFDAEAKQTYRWDAAIRALKCHRLNLNGSLYLRDCKSEGEISFSGAKIGGDIDCRDGHFRCAGNGDTTALRFTRIVANGNVYLSDGFDARGKVQFNGARIRGNIDCQGGTFSVPEGLESRDIAAPGEAFSEDAVSLVNAEVLGAFMLAPIERTTRPAAILNGSLDFKSAYIRVLVDSEETWPRSSSSKGAIRHVIHLDGFTYERFGGIAPIDAEARKRWLKCQPAAHMGHDFKPQPFEQVIKVLKNMGHPDEARRLAIERQGFLVRRRLSNSKSRKHGHVRAVPRYLWESAIGLLIGHGYKPLRILVIMAAVGVLFGFYYKLAAERGIFAPRDAQVFTQAAFDKCRGRPGGWTTCSEVEPTFAEYSQFNPWVYSFNVLLPVVDLYQEKNWTPMRKEVRFEAGGYAFVVPNWGTNALVLTEVVFGWVASLLAVAAFSGLVKTE